MSLATLHPAERRRLERSLPPEAPHEVVLRPLGGGGPSSTIFTSGSEDFIETLFEDLKASDWRKRLAAMAPGRRQRDGVPSLGLPIHRKFQLALFELVCRVPGQPRVDPTKIASQGLVVRRRGAQGWTGWMRAGTAIAGWKRVGANDDPDPVLRSGAHPANRAVRSLIAERYPAKALAEDVVPLYVAPPDVCAARRRTILYAIVPLVSAERIDGPAPRVDYAASRERAEFEKHLSEYLKPRPKTDMPQAGNPLDRNWKVLDKANPDGRLRALGLFLHQMMVELDALSNRPPAKALMQRLAKIRLRTREGSIDAASFVRRAAPILVGDEPAHGFAMPLEWPRVSDADGARLTRAALDCLSDHQQRLERPPAKYDDPTDQYAVRGFVRIRGHDGCPDRLVWSGYSERFRIRPWWDGDGPGTKIKLPDLSQLKGVKPNVSFEMPPSLAGLLQGDMKKLKDGDDPGGPQFELGWLCSFSIPIITLCAFIVLNIFLTLFDLILRWMLLVKICIPIPVPKQPPSD